MKDEEFHVGASSQQKIVWEGQYGESFVKSVSEEWVGVGRQISVSSE